MQKRNFLNQALPLVLTAVTFAAMVGLLWLEIQLLNKFTSDDIQTTVILDGYTCGPNNLPKDLD
jgi:hypothetical protein